MAQAKPLRNAARVLGFVELWSFHGQGKRLDIGAVRGQRVRDQSRIHPAGEQQGEWNVANQTNFWLDGDTGAPGDGTGTRQFSSHVPWGDGTVYSDTGGCCEPSPIVTVAAGFSLRSLANPAGSSLRLQFG